MKGHWGSVMVTEGIVTHGLQIDSFTVCNNFSQFSFNDRGNINRIQRNVFMRIDCAGNIRQHFI